MNSTRQERLLDVIKWWLIIALGAVAFYVVYPKFNFIRVELGKIYGVDDRYIRENRTRCDIQR